jgi:hypothetical protein
VKTVLITDSNLHFVFWLGQTLDAAGYESFPARSISEATAILAEIPSPIEVLVINPALPGAQEFVNGLLRGQEFLKVICLEASGRERTHLPADTWGTKSDVVDELGKGEWLQAMERLFAGGGPSHGR